MSKYVLDASALLALLNQEKGKERVEALLPDSIISAANFCEALGKLIDAGMNETDARESIGLLNIRVISFNEEMARLASCMSARPMCTMAPTFVEKRRPTSRSSRS